MPSVKETAFLKLLQMTIMQAEQHSLRVKLSDTKLEFQQALPLLPVLSSLINNLRQVFWFLYQQEMLFFNLTSYNRISVHFSTMALSLSQALTKKLDAFTQGVKVAENLRLRCIILLLNSIQSVDKQILQYIIVIYNIIY
mgnify:CR=1 FL=1